MDLLTGNMDSFTHRCGSGFRNDPKPGSMVDSTGDPEFSAVLEIHIHHARNIHNICIYDNQDVYAKFSLTCNPDETVSTSIIEGGGKNPDFDQRVSVKVNQPDLVLKCEMWMLSRARNYMEDQLLGFALVPLLEIAGKGKVTADYSLSSTDLFHSPAGTVRLSLSLDATSLPVDPLPLKSSITSEVVLLDRKITEVDLGPVEYSRIEFPDINVVAENQQMVSEYFTASSKDDPIGIASFLHLGSCPISQHPLFEYGILGNYPGNSSSASSGGSVQNSRFLSSTITSISEDGNSFDSIKNKGHLPSQETVSSMNPEANQCSVSRCPHTLTSKEMNEAGEEKGSSNTSERNPTDGKIGPASNNSFEQVSSANLEADQSAMQQQIMGMYMRSMQQFTESLAKMKLPMDLDGLEHQQKSDLEQRKNDGSRVFYGSRAFF